MRALGVAAGRERVDEPGHPAGEIADRGEHATHRRQGPVGVHALADQHIVVADVPVGEACLLDILRPVRRRRHAERHQDPVADELAVLLPSRVGDHPAQDPVAEVRVLERRARRPRQRRVRREEALEGVERQPLLAVAPRIVGGEAGRHREQLADRHGRRVARRRAPGREGGDVGRDRIVESQPALVAQQEERGRRERLRHRGDPEHGVRVRPPLLAVADRAGARRMDEPAVTNHAPGHARDPRLALEALEAGVDRGQQVVERGHAPVPSGVSPNTRNVSTSRKPERLVQVPAHRRRLEDRDRRALAPALGDRMAGHRATRDPARGPRAASPRCRCRPSRQP